MTGECDGLRERNNPAFGPGSLEEAGPERCLDGLEVTISDPPNAWDDRAANARQPCVRGTPQHGRSVGVSSCCR